MFVLVFIGLVTMTLAQHSGYNYEQQEREREEFDGSIASDSNNDLVTQSLDTKTSSSSHSGSSIQSLPIAEEFQKEFFTYSAPEEQFNDEIANQNVINTQKQNLRVLFIKTPENKALENAALSLAKQASDQKTAIYVLQKQTDIGSLAKRLQVIKQQIDNRPEVHFIKYRTPQDALEAQKTIQDQFDALPGSSHNSNEGTAPVLNFASKFPTHSVASVQGPGSQYLPQYPVPNQEYLPVSLRRNRLK